MNAEKALAWVAANLSTRDMALMICIAVQNHYDGDFNALLKESSEWLDND